MKLLRQLCIIVIICFAGEILHTLLNLPIPGNVIGMMLLLIGLCTGLIKLEMIDEISTFLLDHLAFFFLPAGVGLIACFGAIKYNWPKLLLICLFSTVVVMSTTGLIVQTLMKSKKTLK